MMETAQPISVGSTDGVLGAHTASMSSKPTTIKGTGTPDGREPRFALPDSTPRSSKTTIVVGGVRIYFYGIEEALAASSSSPHKPEVAVLLLAHNRTRTYRVTEGIAHEVLNRYRNDSRPKKMGLIAVTMDMRNHGEREISPESNLTWSGGNEQHAMDLLSLIDGGVHDFKLVMDYLPMYLPQFSRLHNIMGGVSLGGHVAWRMAALASPGQVAAYVMVVGCPNLTSLLLGRLGIKGSEFAGGPVDETRLDRISYDELEPLLSSQQRQRWPRALADHVGAADKYAAEEFPRDVPMLLCNGIVDELVPARYTAAWAERRKQDTQGTQPIELNIQDNTGHSCTKEMVARIASWLGDLYEAK
ncbi:rna polymerase ii holoenzyme mediator subunit [Ophiostoma piceae UAMH 11346]|uniref:Rna polymerase ii holoenzyme mediator subunit n=1 Tax=Ophiostoma piceae (strain UAMH 11346) TaxID=1262450 RepID=S3BT27_OPHP1|nr:rna polymerase ii holoenzyme mediator subunit [Ophiostoma piceae UAMH 11346]